MLTTIKKHWRLLIATSTTKELWFITAALILLGAAALLGATFFLVWLSVKHSQIFAGLLLSAFPGVILFFLYLAVLVNLKAKRDLYRREDGRP
ncbi:hypothetical protein [Agrobacterium cavarae]|uniref:hypothetical protein n=1 Tax=Agrobacterium cavarae TaxID=2528239 RepID=UPI00289854B7|nr:hypothetical protein [Agrobacterium cavarae]